MTRRIGRVVLVFVVVAVAVAVVAVVAAAVLVVVVVLGGKCWQDSGKPHHWWQLHSRWKSSLSCVCVALETLMEIELLSNQFNFFFKPSFLK